MAQAMRVPTIFTAVDRFSDVVDKMTTKTSRFATANASAFNRVDRRLNSLWSSMNNLSQLALGGGIASLFYYAGKDVMDYETAIHSLSAVTGTKVGAMNKQIEDLAKTSQRSAIDVAKSFEIVGSKMSEYLDKPDALKEITKNSILMAEAARMELEPAIDSLTGVLNIYGLAANDANRVVNKLSAGEIVGSISISQTADLLKQFGGTARLANVGVEESIALVQTLTKSLGIEGVGRGIRNLMVDLNMVGAFDKNKTKALQKAGVNTKILGDKTLDLVTRLKELKKLEGNSAAMGMFFKKTGIQTGATLFQNFDDLERFLTAIQNTNKAQEQAAKNTDTLSYAIKRLKAGFTNFIVSSDEANASLKVAKSLLGFITDNMGALINIITIGVVAFAGWKTIVLLMDAFSFATSIANKALKAYRLTQLAAAVSGKSYTSMLLSGTAPLAAWAIPLAIVAAGVAYLGYMMYRNNETSKRFADDKVTHFKVVSGAYESMEQKIARSNERIVANMKKFKMDLESVKKTGKTIAELRGEQGAMAVSAHQSEFIKNNTLKSSSSLSSMPSKLIIPKVVSDSDTAFKDVMGSMTKENLAGSNDKVMKDLTKMFANGTLNINLNDPFDVVKDMEYQKPNGTKVVLTPNQGQRGK
jgi:TP901 family phage tail tape measure protein